MRLQTKWIDGWAYAFGTGPDGKRIRQSLKTQDARRAEEARSHLEARLWKLHHYGAEAVVTFDEAALSYARDGGEARFLVKVAEQLKGKVLREITPNMIRDAARRAYPNAKPATLNRQGIVPARAVMNYAHKQGWCGAIRVQSFDVPTTRKVAVTQSYLDALRHHIPQRTWALLMFLHYTGRRVGEALALTPDRLNFDRAVFHDTKNGEDAVAVMPLSLAAIVATLEPRNGRVFGYADRSSLYATLRRGCKKAGLPYLGTHQVGRHSYATMLDSLGWTAKQIADAGGWKSPALVQKTYVHTDETQAKAAKLLGKKLSSVSGENAVKSRKRKDNSA